jgi:DNA-binding transcriptional LysR family regulator
MSLDLASLVTFTQVAETSSFTRAAKLLQIPKARVSYQVRALEAQLETRLFHRTTRSVRLTPDGARLQQHAQTLLTQAEALKDMFSGAQRYAGRVRVDLPVDLARNAVLPRVGELLDRYPQLDLQVSTTDRLIDVVHEGFDAVVRVAALRDSTLVARRLGQLAMINVAARQYLARHGRPRSVHDLDAHRLIHYSASLSADMPDFEYHDGRRWRVRTMRPAITVNSAAAFLAACRAGLGIAQMPKVGASAALESGDLCEVLPSLRAQPLPVHLLHPHGRHVPPRVRVVLDWLVDVLRTHIAAAA